jgi:hypothetical protein
MGRIIGGFFVLLVGLGMLWGTWALAQSTIRFKAEAERVEGTVVDFETRRETSDGKTKTMYAPIVEYTTLDGQTLSFTSASSSSSPSYDRGDKVGVLYSRVTPERARVDSFMDNWFGPMILGLFAVLFTLGGVGLFFGGIRNKKVRKWLEAHGLKVQTRFHGVEQNTSLKVNGKSPWRVCTQWQDPKTQKVYLLYSDNLWYDPTEFCRVDTIDALINADNPKQYFLDTSFLPQRG